MTARWNSDNLLTLKRSFPSKVGATCLDAGEPLAAHVSSSRWPQHLFVWLPIPWRHFAPNVRKMSLGCSQTIHPIIESENCCLLPGKEVHRLIYERTSLCFWISSAYHVGWYIGISGKKTADTRTDTGCTSHMYLIHRPLLYKIPKERLMETVCNVKHTATADRRFRWKWIRTAVDPKPTKRQV